jgi:hypothetical protein
MLDLNDQVTYISVVRPGKPFPEPSPMYADYAKAMRLMAESGAAMEQAGIEFNEGRIKCMKAETQLEGQNMIAGRAKDEQENLQQPSRVLLNLSDLNAAISSRTSSTSPRIPSRS